jgi:voltage-gated potassium channel
VSLRHRLHVLLHNPSGDHRASLYFNRALAFLILANALAVALETDIAFAAGHEDAFALLEAFSLSFFLVEYVARLWACVEHEKYRGRSWPRLRWATSFVSLADLLALATFLLPYDLRFLRLLRLMRLMRVANVHSFAETLERLRVSVRERRDLLIVTGLLMFIALFISASLVYYFEHAAQPKVFSSIPASLWWAVVTLTTTGYGDMTPITAGGRVWAALSLVFGVGVFALPGAILTSAVISASEKARPQVCPHCGRPLQ